MGSKGGGYSKNYGSGGNSKSFRGGSNRHNGGSISQSGSQNFGYSGQTRQPKRSTGPTIGQILFGPGPKNMTHGGKKKRK